MRAITDAAGIAAGAADYWLGLYDPESGGFRFAPDKPPTLMATAYAVLGLEFVGGLDRLGENGGRSVAAFLRSGARPDGTFLDPRLRLEDVVGTEHDQPYFLEETTTFCQQALDALLVEPAPRRAWPAERDSPDGMVAYFESLPWRNAWLDSNRVMFALSQLCHEADRHGRDDVRPILDAALDWLDAHQSPDTGVWSGRWPVAPDNAVAATFHFYFFYGYRRRPLRHLERLIDSCLALQERHGLFSGADVGHTCLDYDAIALLDWARLQTDHRRRDVDRALGRALDSILDLANPDGGFAHCRSRLVPYRPGRLWGRVGRLGLPVPRRRVPVGGTYAVCWSYLEADAAASNAFSTWFRLLALAMAAPAGTAIPGVTYRRLPFLGYHDRLAAQTTSAWGEAEAGDERPEKASGAAVAGHRPVVSVVIPARNAARTLPETLASLRGQTYRPWEAIVVDDGSTDGTTRCARKWAGADGRIRLLQQPASGLAKARNRGLAEASGELIHCLDADDLIEPDFYERVVARIGPLAGNGAPVCATTSHCSFEDGTGRLLGGGEPDAAAYTADRLASTNPAPPATYCFERRALDVAGTFDEGLAHCQDWDLWARFASAGVRFLPVPQARAWYRVRTDSLSRRFGSYLDAGLEVVRRGVGESATEAAAEAEASRRIVPFWAYNLLRAVGRVDSEGVRDVVAWGRANLAPGFWRDPLRFGFPRYFAWVESQPRQESGLSEAAGAHARWLRLSRELFPTPVANELERYQVASLTGTLFREGADSGPGVRSRAFVRAARVIGWRGVGVLSRELLARGRRAVAARGDAGENGRT